ncbi:hypothetical protein THRCLA_11707 [Thraustotheca clavata]|uniref:C3H1-type domain-containing protein n=1 Tax=Thraustotheca clavata TaxID=74557 RepID=A0A1V9Y6Y5_9STRA|nr:hypothetical protein THRCLA_11707 [Thraustotheca clavata]
MKALEAKLGDASSIDHVVVQGQLLRKRRFSKALMFADIKLAQKEIIEMIIRAQENELTKEEIVQMNWDLHLGDMISVYGRLERTDKGHLLLVLKSASIITRWETLNPGIPFGHNPQDVVEPSVDDGRVFGQRKEYTNIVQIQGHNACKYYFNNASCIRGVDCHFWHGPIEDYKALRAEWFTKRALQRRQAASLDGDVHDPHEKGMKAQRARIFCDWLVTTYETEALASGSGVIDVAGGKGDIPFELYNKRGIPTTLVEPRPLNPRKVHRKFFAKNNTKPCHQIQACLDDDLLAEYEAFFNGSSLFVGMHPDEATEPIVDYALRVNKPFAVVPCCVMSRKFPNRLYNGEVVGTYDTFIAYLKAKDPRIQSAFLPFAGKNQVLFMPMQ